MYIASRNVEIRVAGLHMPADAAGADGHDRRNLILKGISTDAEDCGKLSLGIRTKDEAVELCAVRGRDRTIACFAHAILALGVRQVCVSMGSLYRTRDGSVNFARERVRWVDICQRLSYGI